MNSTAAFLLSETSQHPVVITTLYELIAAINARADSEDENLAVATDVYLLGTGQVRFLREFKLDNC